MRPREMDKQYQDFTTLGSSDRLARLSMDQFMQVKCKFQLTSETDSSESIHTDNERVRLCSIVDFDRNSTLIVMICSNENGNNHIVTYYIEKRYHTFVTSHSSNNNNNNNNINEQKTHDSSNDWQSKSTNNMSRQSSFVATASPTSASIPTSRIKPRVMVKQIYYHHYNEDIVAISLSEQGNKLAMVSASSTIYIIPIKNILLNLHAKQLRSSQGKSMYFYDASIIESCTIEDPIAILLWENSPTAVSLNDTEYKSLLIVANKKGEVSTINIEDKKQISVIQTYESIKSLEIIKDKFSYSLLINSDDFKQFRLPLQLIKRREDNQDSGPPNPISPDNQPSLASPSKRGSFQLVNGDDQFINEKDMVPLTERKPSLIRLNGSNSTMSAGIHSRTYAAAAAIHRVLVPSRNFNHRNAFPILNSRDRPISSIFYHSSSELVSVVDVLGTHKPQMDQKSRVEPRLLRFFHCKQFYYRPQRPSVICKLSSLDPDELITHVVITERFLAITTDHNRCLIYSRSCCNLKSNNTTLDIDPIVKEIKFTNDERILNLTKSPISNDQDGIIDSFFLITDRSIYSIEARQSCRDMFVNLIDSHLGISQQKRTKDNSTDSNLNSNFYFSEYSLIGEEKPKKKNSEVDSLIINNFLYNRDEVYEKISFDSRIFSILFKLELHSLYEAYGDKLLLRGEFSLANRFFQMAKFDQTRILGKYLRLGAYQQAIELVTSILTDENHILDEKERMDLSKAAFDCLLAKTIIERSKLTLFKEKLKRRRLKGLITSLDNVSIQEGFASMRKCNPYRICEHSPIGQEAKMSTTTIVGEDEETLTADEGRRHGLNSSRLGCEMSLIHFANTLLPQSLYSYILGQLVDFGLIDVAEMLARFDNRIYSLIRIVLKAKNENRMVFREARFETLVQKLVALKHDDLIHLDGLGFLRFITTPEATRALVRDISLAEEYLGHQQSLFQFRKYSFAALRQFDSFRKLVIKQTQITGDETCEDFSSGQQPSNGLAPFSDDEKQSIEKIFLEFMLACLNESTGDSCRLWFNYINFYLNYIDSVDKLKQDILNLLDIGCPDCRLAITLYKSIGKDEKRGQQQSSSKFLSILNADRDAEISKGTFKRLYNLHELFDNVFLMKVLEKTLTLIPKSAVHMIHSFEVFLMEPSGGL